MIKSVNNTSRLIVLAIPPRTCTIKEASIITQNTIICNNLLADNSNSNTYEYYDITNDFVTINITTNQFELMREYYCDDVHFSDEGYKLILERLTSIIDK